jgi:ketosteroid isomerase-like protein
VTTLTADDRWALQDLVCRYFDAVDDQDAEAFSTVFLPDATADLGVPDAPPCAGRDEILALILATVEPLDSTDHQLGTHRVLQGPGGVRGRTTVTAHHFKDGARYTLGCRYTDEFEKTPDGWRIRNRTLTVLWADGDPAVLA